VFNVDELVVIDDTPQRKDGTVGAGAAFLARVVQYLETPQYLRRALVPMHSDLRLAVRFVYMCVGGCFSVCVLVVPE
jgi:predicted SPOUT superfamily RNA methylase MTH1